MQALKNEQRTKYYFILPAFLFVAIMVIIPVLYTFFLSFTKWSMAGKPDIIWFDNYLTMFADSRFLKATYRTLLFSAAALLFEVVLGTGIALFLNRDFIGKPLVKTFFLLPMVATPVSIGLVWMLIYEPTFGIANTLLGYLGFEHLPLWLGSPDTALLALVIMDIWQWTPMISLIVMAGLAALPTEPIESAHVDGAKAYQILFRVTLPMITPTVVVASLLRLIDALKTFDIIYATTQGGPTFSSETLNVLAFINAFQYFDLGYASAMLVVFFLLVLVLSLLVGRLRDRVRIDF
ncbi:MAG: carbohydrate ABC transporter permease [Sphaerochaeta sp.]|uniref:carbohydrate ABC transporter permease n=1 Tax=Sphaerochaeta sp. TaxID=1972642 RepID=UPI003D0EF4FE